MYLIYHLRDMEKAAGFILKNTGDKKIFAFYGEMGAGKTSLIKEICQLLKVTDIVNSPTFAIIYEYKTLNNTLIYHFDFYRINNINEVLTLGYEDYFYSGNYCFIEWPEKIENLLPADTVKIKLTAVSAMERKLEIIE